MLPPDPTQPPETADTPANAANEQATYNIGYKKPPTATRFKPGHSGNRSGRPRGAKNASTLIEDALLETISVTTGGKRLKMSKLKAMYIQQANKAAAGDAKAFALMDSKAQRIEEKRVAEKPASIPVTEADAEILRHIAERGQEPISHKSDDENNAPDAEKNP